MEAAARKTKGSSGRPTGRPLAGGLGTEKISVSVRLDIKAQFDEAVGLPGARSGVIQALMEAWIKATPSERAAFITNRRIG